jgi:carbonic anhydrase
MHKTRLSIAILTFLTTAPLLASESAHWGYDAESGPSHWGELSPQFNTCGTGKNQSPVDLNRLTDGNLDSFKEEGHVGSEVIENNGHTIEVKTQPGSYITLDGIRFELRQFHFHSPSENHIKGKSFPLEAHLVHEDKDGNLAVVAVMFETGKDNPALTKLWAQMPKQPGESSTLSSPVNVEQLLPSSGQYYRYDGSLTTPPCTEGVRWLVMKTPVDLSKQQLSEFTNTIGGPNNRPVQPMNARLIIE